MEIGQAPSWSSRELEDKSSTSPSSSVTEAKETSILLVDIVWTILIFGAFLGTAYLIKRSRDVCYTVSSPGSDHVIGSCKNSKKPAHNQLSLEINNSGSGSAGPVGHGTSAGGRLDLEFSLSSSCSSVSSVGSNLSSFWSSHHDHGLDLIRLSSKATKVASSSSIAGQSCLPATASLTLHEFEVSPRATPSSHDHDGHIFALVGRSNRVRKLSALVDNNLHELALRFPPGGSYYKHGGSAAGGSISGGSRRPDTSYAQHDGEAAGKQMYYHEIQGHEDLEEKIQSEINVRYDASTKTDRVNERGLGARRDDYDHHNERSVKGDVEQDLQLQHDQLAATQSRVTVSKSYCRDTRTATDASVHVHEEPFTSRPENADLKKVGEPLQVENDNISTITQLQSRKPTSSIDYGQFHFSDPDLNERWRS